MSAGVFRGLGTLALATSMVACGSAAGTPQAVPGAADVQVLHSDAAPRNHCDADAVASLAGTVWAPALLARVLTDAGADEARMLHEDSIITKEYQPGRVNVVVDANGQVVRVYCG